MCQLVLVLLAVVAGYAGAATIPWCCTEKSVGGVNYTLVNTWENTTMYGCEWDCVYEQNGLDGSRVCFKEGGLPVVCYEDECVFPNSQYKGSAFYPGTVGLKNHTDCQKLCKDHNKINQKKCNYWNFSPPRPSTFISNCDMYENITGIEQNTGNRTFRGPINEYCPYLGFTPFDECFFPNSSYVGYSYIIYTTSAANYTDCQQQCNQQRGTTENTCKFWNYEPPVGSTDVSCTLMYNITSIQTGLDRTFVRGPINENCPAHI